MRALGPLLWCTALLGLFTAEALVSPLRTAPSTLHCRSARSQTSLSGSKWSGRLEKALRPLKKTVSLAALALTLLAPMRPAFAKPHAGAALSEGTGRRRRLDVGAVGVDGSVAEEQVSSTGDASSPQRQRTSLYDYFGNPNSKNEPSSADSGSSGGGGSATSSTERGAGSMLGSLQNPKRNSRPSGSSSFVREAVRTVGPSVVRIDCERDIPQMVTMFAPENFREGDTMKVSGSGFVVSSDGFILTNAHVVEGAKKTTVSLSNGRSFKAAIVALDELTDLAVLKAEITSADSKFLTIAPLGDSSKLQSGDWVIAVGCPVGLDFTVTLGIVSSPKRSATEVGATHLKGSYIQTDAALNSGNSGGPLVNDVGEVVGINTMVRTNTEAIGFAIPINRARKIYEVLKQGRKPTHAYFGIEVMTITPDFAHIHNDDPNAQRLAQIHGALVTRVLPGSPAAASGLRKNDIILGVNGNSIANSHDADIWLDQCKPGAPAKLKIARGENGGEVQVDATPENLLTMIEEKNRRRGGGGGGGGGPAMKPKSEKKNSAKSSFFWAKPFC